MLEPHAPGVFGALHPIHPEHAGLSPVVAGAIVVFAVVAAALVWPGPGSRPRLDDRPLESWLGRLSRFQVAGRAVGVALVALAVAAGRLGKEDELANLAPALVVGFAWPALLFASAVGGPAWRWLDPWDGLARAIDRAEEDPAPDVHAALVPAIAWVWYLSVFLDALSPRSVGLALGVYGVAMLGGALVFGRVSWLSRVDVFGLLFGWLARLPRGLLPSWTPPRGAELVIGALAGGLAFGAIRTSEIWGELNVADAATVYATVGALGSALVVAGLLWTLERWAMRTSPRGSVTAASLPAAASIALAVALARSRLFTSLQLLPSLLVDPFDASPVPILPPLEPVPLAAVQLLVVVVGCVAGAAVLARRAERDARRPGILALAILAAVGVTAISVAPGL